MTERDEEHNASDTDELSLRLFSERPVPRPGFRAELRARLLSGRSARREPSRAERIRVVIGAYATTGAALLLIATLGVAGAGPLAS